MTAELPVECAGCTKSGMEAVACLVFTFVPESLMFGVQCSTAHYDKDARTTTSGKTLGAIRRNGKPSVVNSSAGRTKATHPKIGY